MSVPASTRYTIIASPIGDLLVTGERPAGNGLSITGLYTPGHLRSPGPEWVRDDDAFTDIRTQLGEYFAGRRHQFDLALTAPGTAFQEAVWKALREIPYAGTASYSALAARIGAPTAVRAVGAANGRNPISIVVPCHRVIGADGSLTGYAGGIETKRWLLRHEQSVVAPGGRYSPPSRSEDGSQVRSAVADPQHLAHREMDPVGRPDIERQRLGEARA